MESSDWLYSRIVDPVRVGTSWVYQVFSVNRQIIKLESQGFRRCYADIIWYLSSSLGDPG